MFSTNGRTKLKQNYALTMRLLLMVRIYKDFGYFFAPTKQLPTE